MKLNIMKLQMGGPVADPQGAPAGAPPAGGGDPLMEMAGLAEQALSSNDCQAALAVCEAFLQLVAQASPQPEPAPTFQRQGGRLVRKK